MSVLVTGGAGFIGFHTVRHLVEDGYHVVVIDKVPSKIFSSLDKHDGKIDIIRCDIIKNLRYLREIVREANYIIHLAAIVNVVEVEEKPIYAFKNNVLGVHVIANLANKYEVNKIIFASSAAVYGEPCYIPIDENHPVNPKNLYGLTKVLGELILRWYSDNYGLKYTILRYFNVYGPRMKLSGYANVIAIFISNALRNLNLTIYGDGNQTRDFIFVDDVAVANVLALKSKREGIYNVGTGKETRIIDLARAILKLTESRSKIVFKEPRPVDVRRSVANISRIKKDLGWQPKYSLEEGLKETILWFRKVLVTNQRY